MRTMQTVVFTALVTIILAGCQPLLPLIGSLSQDILATPYEPMTVQHQGTDTDTQSVGESGLCAPENIDCVLEKGTIVQLTAMCEFPDSIPGGDDDCTGTYVYNEWVLEPLSSVTAYHEGDGKFEVTLFRDDGSSDVLFSATGVYTSETIMLAPTGIVSMTVQSTGPWHVDIKLVEE